MRLLAEAPEQTRVLLDLVEQAQAEARGHEATAGGLGGGPPDQPREGDSADPRHREGEPDGLARAGQLARSHEEPPLTQVDDVAGTAKAAAREAGSQCRPDAFWRHKSSSATRGVQW